MTDKIEAVNKENFDHLQTEAKQMKPFPWSHQLTVEQGREQIASDAAALAKKLGIKQQDEFVSTATGVYDNRVLSGEAPSEAVADEQAEAKLIDALTEGEEPLADDEYLG